jgi:hypothetical protein
MEKDFWKTESFEGSRRVAQDLGRATRLLSGIYRMVEEEKRRYKVNDCCRCGLICFIGSVVSFWLVRIQFLQKNF